MAMGDDESADYADASLILGLVKERFHGRNKYVYDRFIHLIKTHGHLDDENEEEQTTPQQQQQIIQNRAALFSKLNSLFTPKNNDLIEKLRNFMNYPVAVLDEESTYTVLEESVDFVNKVKETFKHDHEKFMQFIKIVLAYKQHKDSERVRIEVYPLFKEHPALELLFAGEFLVEAQEGYCRTVTDMLASRERERAVLEERLNNGEFKVRKLGEDEKLLIRKEEQMEKSDRKFDRMICVKDALQKLIDDYSGRNARNRMEAVRVGDCVSDFDLMCLRDMFNKNRKYYSLLHEELVEVRKAVDEAKDIVRCLVKRMYNFTRGWPKDKEELVRSNHYEAYNIELFDWRSR